MKRELSLVLGSAFLIISILHLLVYTVGAQLHRQAANEAPRAMTDLLLRSAGKARGAAALLDPEVQLAAKITGSYPMICASDGRILAGGTPKGDARHLPRALTAKARTAGTQYITWDTGGRYALAVRAVPDSQLIVGACQPLRVTESNLLRLCELVLLSWAACTAVLAFAGALWWRRVSPRVAPLRIVPAS